MYVYIYRIEFFRGSAPSLPKRKEGRKGSFLNKISRGPDFEGAGIRSTYIYASNMYIALPF